MPTQAICLVPVCRPTKATLPTPWPSLGMRGAAKWRGAGGTGAMSPGLWGCCWLNSQGFCETVITVVACTQAWQDIYSMAIGKCYKSRLCAHRPARPPPPPPPGDLFVKHQHSPGRG